MNNETALIATFPNPVEAELARTRLEDAQIWCVIHDAGIVGADPLLNIAVGGIKLVVLRSDVERAAEILHGPRDGCLEDSVILDDQHYPDDDGPGGDAELLSAQLACPSCGSEEIGLGTLFHVTACAIIAVFVVPMLLPAEPAWDWARWAQLPVLSTLMFLAFWGAILRLFPLRCDECGHGGRRREFQRS